MGRILRLHASFISTRKPSYNGLPMPLGQALFTRKRVADLREVNRWMMGRLQNVI